MLRGFCRDCRHDVADDGVALPGVPLASPAAPPELDTLSIAHVDCDAFYATIEKRDDPSLADKPVIVGGGQRGVVLTCCYVARTYGVRSAMPMFEARRLCPHASHRPAEHGEICRRRRAGARADARSHAAGRAGVDRRSVHGPLRHRAAAWRAAGQDAGARSPAASSARSASRCRSGSPATSSWPRSRPTSTSRAASRCSAATRRRRSWRRVRSPRSSASARWRRHGSHGRHLDRRRPAAHRREAS